MANRSPVLIITRPEGAAEGFARHVRARLDRPVETIITPLIRIEPCDPDGPVPNHRGVILTSANAVPALGRLGIAPGTPAWCVGSRTARAARDAGLETRDADGDAEALVRMILKHRPDGMLLHLRGEVSRGDVADRLNSAGVPCAELVVYRQTAQALSSPAREALSGVRPVVIPLFSPRTAAIFRESGPFKAPVHVIAMSRQVATSVEDLPLADLVTVDMPDGEHMLSETVRTLRGLSSGAA